MLNWLKNLINLQYSENPPFVPKDENEIMGRLPAKEAIRNLLLTGDIEEPELTFPPIKPLSPPTDGTGVSPTMSPNLLRTSSDLIGLKIVDEITSYGTEITVDEILAIVEREGHDKHMVEIFESDSDEAFFTGSFSGTADIYIIYGSDKIIRDIQTVVYRAP